MPHESAKHRASHVLAAVLLAGCSDFFDTTYHPVTLSVGITPVAVLGRSGLDTSMELRGAGGVDLFLIRYGEDLCGVASLGYVPFEQGLGDSGGGLLRFDIGIAAGATSRGDSVLSMGPSLAYIHFDEAVPSNYGRNTLAGGWFFRAEREVFGGRKLGITLHADLRGWVGFDGHGLAVAGSAELGAGVVYSF